MLNIDDQTGILSIDTSMGNIQYALKSYPGLAPSPAHTLGIIDTRPIRIISTDNNPMYIQTLIESKDYIWAKFGNIKTLKSYPGLAPPASLLQCQGLGGGTTPGCSTYMLV